MQHKAIKSRTIHLSRLIGNTLSWLTKALLPFAALALSAAAWADFELTAPDGRRVLLKEDGTWKYQDARGDKDKAKAQQIGEAVLQLEQKIERGAHCRVVFRLANNLPYEIGHIVPYVSAYRANGAMHETVSVAFQSIRPADKIERTADFSRITCAEITRIQVSGGDRCLMGDLTKFSEANGQCLARVRVAPSDLLRFDK